MQNYAKAIVGVIGAALTAALGLVPGDSKLFLVLTVLSAAVTAAGVYLVPNTQTDKTAAAGVLSETEAAERALQDETYDGLNRDDLVVPDDAEVVEGSTGGKHVAA